MIKPAIAGAAGVLASLLAIQSLIAPAPIAGDVSVVKLVSAPTTDLKPAFDTLCAQTGCDAESLARVVQAGAAAMSMPELQAALTKQAALLDRMAQRAEAAQGSAAKHLALAMAVESEIADIYRAAIAAHATD